MKIPNLAIHLMNQEERTKMAPNTESHLRPIMATSNLDKLT